MTGAGEALTAAVIAAARAVGGFGVHDGPPVQAAFPYAVVETGPETDWGHKSGEGREARIAIVIRDKGERPARLRRLMSAAETALTGIGGEIDPGWRVVTMVLARSRMVRDRDGVWAGLIEYRARMLADPRAP